MDEWLPIETAPRDGTYVELWSPGWSRPLRGFFDADHGAEGMWRGETEDVMVGPTHWKPLAEVPGDAAAITENT